MLPMIEEKRLQELLRDIFAYMSYLREKENLFLSVHQIDDFARAFMDEVRPYNFHTCPYCEFMKAVPGVHGICVQKQKALPERIGPKPFFGTCWAGVGEYLFPLADRNGMCIGLISVSGYAGDSEKTAAQTEKISRRFEIDPADMRAMQDTLRRDRPPFEQVSAYIMPLTHMFTMLQSYLENFGAAFVGANLGQSELFDRVCSFLRAHFSTDYKLSEVARHFAVSESSLSRLFTTYSAYSYRGYINAMRVNIGKFYLTNTDMSVRELSELLGYSTPNYFSTVFRRESGLTPEKFRESNHRENRHIVDASI